MKWFLTVYFLVNGNWLPGDVVAPNGWSSIEYNTEQACTERRDYMNENFANSVLKDLVVGKCSQLDPSKPYIGS